MIDYVAAVAAAWHGAGLRAARAFRAGDVGYTSRFHRFCDLLLTVLVEPRSRRHGEELERFAYFPLVTCIIISRAQRGVLARQPVTSTLPSRRRTRWPACAGNFVSNFVTREGVGFETWP